MDVELAGLAIALIVVLGLDAVACAGPIAYIKADLERLGCTPQEMKIIPAVKFLAVAGLIIGLWTPWIGALACIGMLIYFGFAFWYHDRANDPFAKYVPAIAFAAFIAAVLFLSYLPAA